MALDVGDPDALMSALVGGDGAKWFGVNDFTLPDFSLGSKMITCLSRDYFLLKSGSLEAVRREVEEESGMLCEPEDIVSVEVQGGGWYRLSFLCSLKGGSLKSCEQKDTDSVQAAWFPVKDVLNYKKTDIPIRAKDMLDLVKRGCGKYANKVVTNSSKKVAVLEAPVPGMFIQLLVVQEKAKRLTTLQNLCGHFTPFGCRLVRCKILLPKAVKHVHRKDCDEGLEVLLSRDTANKGRWSLPIVEYPLNSFAAAVISKFYREILTQGSGVLEVPNRCVGIQCLPCPSHEHDGLCLTLLCKVKPKMDPKPSRPERYFWSSVDSTELKSALEEIMVSSPHFILL